MKISPRYGDHPVIDLPTTVPAIREAFLRQRRRLVEEMRTLDIALLERPSRCAGWMGRDVLAHLQSVDGFWAASITLGVGGRPTTFLSDFDPEGTPAAMVEATREKPTALVLAEFAAAAEALCAGVEALDDEAWEATAEAPPGHLPVRTVVHHALWDCWIHERDILLPLGIAPPEDDDEVAACLRYCAALDVALGLDVRAARGAFVIEADTPTLRVRIEATDTGVNVSAADEASDEPVLRGGAVDLVEGLSVRAPLPGGPAVATIPLLGGLAAVFAPSA